MGGTDNQDSTLEGVVDLTFLEYPNVAKTIELFALASTTPGTALTKLFPGMVAGVNIVKVKSGREEDFHRLRTQVQAATRSSRDVKSFTTFDVLQDVLDPSDPLYFDATNNELWMSTFESLDVRE